MLKLKISLNNEKETLKLGEFVSISYKREVVVYLYGDIGTGKTTFSRGFLHSLGYFGYVKSPTYTIIESYSVKNIKVYHLDLYRITDSKELEFIGIRDFFSNKASFLIEWPNNGVGFIPHPEIKIQLEYQNEKRKANITAFLSPESIYLKRLCNYFSNK